MLLSQEKLTGIFLFNTEELLDLVAHLAIRDLHIILGIPVVGHKGEKPIFRDIQLCHGQRVSIRLERRV